MRLLVLFLMGCGRIAFDPRGDANAVDAPDAYSGACVAQLSGEGTQTCALVGASGQLLCKGVNNFGEVGDGTMSRRDALVPAFDDVAFAGPGEFNTCAVRRDGTAWCWGDNFDGQHGNNTMSRSLVPTQVAGLADIRQIVTGQYNSCALSNSGNVWCWGDGTEGTVGDGMQTDRLLPTLVPSLSGIEKIALNDRVACALGGGALQCWGAGSFVGDNTVARRLSPVPVTLPRPVMDVAGGCGLHMCAITVDGDVYCWGDNPNGELGDASLMHRNAPVRAAGFSSAVEVGLGAYHSCARIANGNVYCWGADDAGQRSGTAGAIAQSPELLPFLFGVEEMAIGCRHSCVRTQTEGVKCWGNYEYGAAVIQGPAVLPVPGCP